MELRIETHTEHGSASRAKMYHLVIDGETVNIYGTLAAAKLAAIAYLATHDYRRCEF